MRTRKQSSGPRVVLKLTGESFCQENTNGITVEQVNNIALNIAEAWEEGVELAIVVGGGNIIRGATLSRSGVDRTTADYMGMTGTLINALALQEALEKIQVPTRVQSALHVSQVAEPFIRRRAARHLEKGRVVILAGGAGMPFFTTDTVAVLRAKELDAVAVYKATKVDGVYTADPTKYPHSVRYDDITYEEVLLQELNVMDATAITLARENNIPIKVFNFREQGSIKKAILHNNTGTWIKKREA